MPEKGETLGHVQLDEHAPLAEVAQRPECEGDVPCCRGPRWRYLIAAQLACAMIVCYADRTNIGIAVLDFPSVKGNDSKQGWILASFFYGYICTQIFGGWWAHKVGGKIVLLCAVFVWTIFDISTVFTEPVYGLLIASRVGMGLGEGMTMPVLHNLASRWYPEHEITRLVNVQSSGQDLGMILALSLSPVIGHALSWKWIFITFAIFSAVWQVLFLIFGSKDPESHPLISEEEKRYLVRTRQLNHTGAGTRWPWRVCFKKRAFIAVFIAHTCVNYGWYVLLGWLPKYCQKVLKTDLYMKPYVLTIPYVCAVCGIYVSGVLSDYLIRRWGKRSVVRKLMNSIGLLLPAVCLVILSGVHDTTHAITVLSIGLFFCRFAQSGYWVNIIDLSPKYLGSPVVPFSPFFVSRFPYKFTSPTKGAFITRWLLGYQGTVAR